MNSSGKCSKCQLVSFASSEVCKHCGPVTKAENTKWPTQTWVGIAAFALMGVILWVLVLFPALEPAPRHSQVVDSLNRSHVVGEQFASLAEQTEWLVNTTSIEDCQNLDPSVTNPGPCETVPLEAQAIRNICTLKKMKAQDPTQWELTLKKLATQSDPVPETER